MITGSMAMNYHAQPRMTRDIDVVIAIRPEDVDRVAALFRPDYYLTVENVREALSNESIFNLIHQESVLKWTASFAKAANTGDWSLIGDRKSRSSTSLRSS